MLCVQAIGLGQVEQGACLAMAAMTSSMKPVSTSCASACRVASCPLPPPAAACAS